MQESISSVVKSKNRVSGASALFLLFALPMPFCLFIYHITIWYVEQTAISSSSLKNLAWSGIIGLTLQTVVMMVITALLWRFTTDKYFKSIYRGLFGAAVMGFPALPLKFLGPNSDQLGSIAQFAICIIGAGVIIFLRKNKIQWDIASAPFGLVIAGIGITPYLIYGSFGSYEDIAFSLLASLAFGLLAATLIESTAENLLFDGVGIGAVLALLGSAIGYDGSQLLLLVMLPSFAFAIAAIMPSKFAAGATVSILTFAALALFDSTELTILLGDIGGIAAKSSAIVILIGVVTSLIALALRWGAESKSGARRKRAVGWAGTAAVWLFIIAAFLILGNPGNYGDRLFIILKDQADLSSVAKIEDRNERLTTAYKTLTEHADKTQLDLRNFFERTNIEYTPYYLENAMEAHGGILLKLYLDSRPEIARVIPSPRLHFAPEDESTPVDSPALDKAAQWNIILIGADKVWDEFGVQGEGIVIGQSDTGADVNHPALRNQYRGLIQGDDYNWYDPWNNTSAPHDELGHGTHTLGTILGAGGIGVAPKAKWMGCMNLDRNLANPALYLECMQFMFAPFPHNGNPFKDGDPTRAAHVLNNSWGCPALEGCDPNALLYAANNLRDAGIFVVVSTGNDGPNCETVESPLALYDSVFSVGAIDELGNMAFFSSRGPVTADGSNRIKPDIVAPGVNILSALPKNSYGTNDGTSMAGPHVAGAVALIWSAQPNLIGDIDATEQLIIDTARHYTGNTVNGCFTGNDPSNAYGYGIVDVYEAVKKALEE